jgi:hypothetical protein
MSLMIALALLVALTWLTGRDRHAGAHQLAEAPARNRSHTHQTRARRGDNRRV